MCLKRQTCLYASCSLSSICALLSLFVTPIAPLPPCGLGNWAGFHECKQCDLSFKKQFKRRAACLQIQAARREHRACSAADLRTQTNVATNAKYHTTGVVGVEWWWLLLRFLFLLRSAELGVIKCFLFAGARGGLFLIGVAGSWSPIILGGVTGATIIGLLGGVTGL